MEKTNLEIADRLNAFTDRYIERGFGTLSKKETDRLVFELLVDIGEIARPFDSHTISRKLKVTLPRAASLIYEYEIFRATERNDSWLRNELANLLGKTQIGKESKNKIRLEVRDKLLREEIENYIRRNNLGPVPDYRLNHNLLEIEFHTFINLLAEMVDQPVLDAIEKELIQRKQISDPLPTPHDLLNQFMLSAAGRAGEKTLDLSAALLSGNISKMFKAIFL